MRKLFFILFLICSSVNQVSAIETLAEQAVIMDYETGTIMLNKNGYEANPPSSMSKLMTLYILFDEIKKGNVDLDDKFEISVKAWKTGGSTMFLKEGETVKVKDLIKGIIVLSGNDACVVVAENIAGSEENFVEMMNEKAKEIGLHNSHFTNAAGLNEPEGHVMSALDLAKLARKLIKDFPQFYKYFSINEFVYKDHTGNRFNRNPLLNKVRGADGLKTGHTDLAGYGFVGSVKRDDRRVIVVINGLAKEKRRGESENAYKARGFRERYRESRKLVEWAFENFDNHTLVKSGDVLGEGEIWYGRSSDVELTVREDVVVTLPNGRLKDVKVSLEYMSPIYAPVDEMGKVGEVKVSGVGEVKRFDLVAKERVKKARFFGKIWDNLVLLFHSIFSGDE